ncbi:MAG TPA: SpoIIE family protein phosphatase, partial [Solirubrobacteraceae bacterium]
MRLDRLGKACHREIRVLGAVSLLIALTVAGPPGARARGGHHHGAGGHGDGTQAVPPVGSGSQSGSGDAASGSQPGAGAASPSGGGQGHGAHGHHGDGGHGNGGHGGGGRSGGGDKGSGGRGGGNKGGGNKGSGGQAGGDKGAGDQGNGDTGDGNRSSGGGATRSGSTATGSGSAGSGSQTPPAHSASTPTPAQGTTTPQPGPAVTAPAGPRRAAASIGRSKTHGGGTPSRSGGAVALPFRAGVSPVGTIGAAAAASGTAQRDRAAPAHKRHPSGAGADGGALTQVVERRVSRVVRIVPAWVWALVAALALTAVALARSSWAMAYRARRLERQREELLADVGLLQRALLPPEPDTLEGLRSTAAYAPATHGEAGGAFYDVFALGPDRLGFLVGAVSIHGRAALGLTALIRHTLRAYLEAGLAPRTALQVAAGAVAGQVGAATVAVTVGIYDRESSILTHASAGQPPPVVLGAAAYEPVIACPAPAIGDGPATGTRQTTMRLPPRALACFVTDSVIAARAGSEELGYRGLWHEVIDLGPLADADAVLERVAATSRRTREDMAAYVLRVGAAAPQAPAG